MLTLSAKRLFTIRSSSRLVLLAAAAVLGGCVVEVPAQRVYEAPPPSEPAAPAEVAAVQTPEPPPPLPEFQQPPCPVEGYMWTPGYWAWGPGGYYWVPGTWVEPPHVGLLWTPGYWAFASGVYVFHAGYWGTHVGFYGGVNYGYGYVGTGYAGGRWVGNAFAYNQAVTNVNVVNVHNVYHETVINNVTVNNVTVNRVSYNGGAGGIQATPNVHERQWAQEAHVMPTAVQQQHIEQASRNPGMFATANGGRPPIAATPQAANFTGPGVVHAKGAVPPTLYSAGRAGYTGTMPENAPHTKTPAPPPPVAQQQTQAKAFNANANPQAQHGAQPQAQYNAKPQSQNNGKPQSQNNGKPQAQNKEHGSASGDKDKHPEQQQH